MEIEIYKPLSPRICKTHRHHLEVCR